MENEFRFDFNQLTLKDQKYLLTFFEAEGCSDVEKFHDTYSSAELLSLFEKVELRKVSHLCYLAALLAHNVLIYSAIPQYHMRKERIFKSVVKNNDVDFKFNLDWYDGLKNEHEGIISLTGIIETYDLLELDSLFKKYEFLIPIDKKPEEYLG
jgi:hypothetical protein